MARETADEDEGNDEEKVGTKPAKNIADARPLAMFGGKSVVEANNPELGPSASELSDREKKMAKARQKTRSQKWYDGQ